MTMLQFEAGELKRISRGDWVTRQFFAVGPHRLCVLLIK